MDTENKLLSLSILASKNKKDIHSVTPTEIILTEQNSVISSDIQPTSGTVYTAAFTCQFIRLPDASKFENPGFRIVIFCPSNQIEINMASESSTDVVTFNGSTYITPTNFILQNRGFVQLVWISSGWLVLNSYGLSVRSN
uniref:Uncharacterized protein n=1 Tax=viral metagenome TaxID=1070528 RepID=A0A6C0BE46_9ZZZZ